MTRPDLSLASNLFGPLDGELRARLTAAIENPCEATWEDAYSIILNRDEWTTLWQAVLAVDPSFGDAQPPVSRWTGTHSEPISGWSHTPSAEVIVQAIRYATH